LARRSTAGAEAAPVDGRKPEGRSESRSEKREARSASRESPADPFEPIADRRKLIADRLSVIARTVSPRVEVHSDTLVTLDVTGLTRLIGEGKEVAERLRRTAADHGILPVRVAVAATRTAAILLACSRVGMTVVPAGDEASALAMLPLGTLAVFLEADAALASTKPRGLGLGEVASPWPRAESRRPPAASRQSPAASRQPDILLTLSRWGLMTLGDLAALPPADLSERLGQQGIWWQRVARGEDAGPLVPTPDEERFESTLELEWPIEGLEPLSFVLGRLLEPLCQRLERRDRGAAMLHIRLRLVTRDTHARSLQLPAPMRDPRVLRTLLLLDLESHPAPAGIDAVTVAIDPTPGRIVQESLLTRALPTPEQMSTLLARLTALMGERRIGAPVVLDSHRPDACALAPFCVPDEGREIKSGARLGTRDSGLGASQNDVRLATGGSRLRGDSAPSASSTHGALGVSSSFPAGLKPDASSRDPRAPSAEPLAPISSVPCVALRRFRLPIAVAVVVDQGRPVSVRTDRQGLRGGRVEAWAGPWRTSGEWWMVQQGAPESGGPGGSGGWRGHPGWNREEWDVALGDGGIYRIFEDRDLGRWFIEGILD
jgi:hypothetical protein